MNTSLTSQYVSCEKNNVITHSNEDDELQLSQVWNQLPPEDFMRQISF